MNPELTNLTAVQIKDFIMLALLGVNLILTFFLFLVMCPPPKRSYPAKRPRPNLRVRPETPTTH